MSYTFTDGSGIEHFVSYSSRMASSRKKQTCTKDRLINFFRDQKFVDCKFIIEDQEIKAHKLVLASNSPVFEKMFFGDWASDEVVLGDIKPEEFNQMLEFMYTERVSLVSVTNAWSLFYIAKKYILEDLGHVCIGYISDHVTLSTLVLSYEYSELYNVSLLQDQLFIDMMDGINVLFVSDYHMKPTTLQLLIREELFISKIDLVCKVIEWAIIECEYRDTDVTPETIVQLLQDVDILRYLNRECILDHICEYCDEKPVICKCFGEIVQKTLIYITKEVIWEELPKIKFFRLAPYLCKSKKVLKIARRLDLQDFEEFVSNLTVTHDMMICGLYICTEMKCSTGTSDEYKGCITIRFCQQYSNLDMVRPTVVRDVFSYNSQVYIPLRFSVLLKVGVVYDVKISYKNYTDLRSSIVCSYMTECLLDVKRPYAKLYFYDVNGTIIKGAAFYPI